MRVSLRQLRCAKGPVHPQDKEPRLWEFPPSLVFRRMDSFLHRLKTIEVTAQHRAWGWGHQGRRGGQTPPWLLEAPSSTAVPPARLVPGRVLLGTLAHVAQPGPGAAAWAPAVPGSGELGLGTQPSQMWKLLLLTRSCTRYPSSS